MDIHIKSSVPVVVFWVGAGGVGGSVPDLRSSFSGVKHQRAEGHTDQPAPGGGRGGGVMEVSALPLSFCQLSEVHLQHPEVSVGEKEERREAEVLSLGEDV